MNLNITTELKSHFLRLYQIACADEDFDILELKQLYKFAEERGVDAEYLKKILAEPVMKLSIPESLNERVEYLYDLAIMTWVDGKVTEDEKNTLKKFCKNFEFENENIEQICEFLLSCAEKKMSLSDVLTTINE